MSEPNRTEATEQEHALLRRYLRAAIGLGVVAPLLLATAATALTVAWLPELPDPVALHFGPSGAPDGFGPAWVTIVLLPLLVVGFTAFAASAMLSGPLLLAGRTVPPGRLGGVWAGGALFFAVVMSGALSGSLLIQRGLGDARDTDGSALLLILLAAVAAGLLLALLAVLLVPRLPLPPETAAAPAALALQPGERAYWRSEARSPRWLRVLVPVLIVGAVLAVALTSTAGWWLAPLLGLVLLVPLSLLQPISVVADGAGLRVHSWGGLLRLRLPLEALAEADVADTAAVAEFGGYGVRLAPGRRWGVITRSGEALRLRRSDGRRDLLVTVDDAATGAALLNGLLAQRARRAR